LTASPREHRRFDGGRRQLRRRSVGQPLAELEARAAPQLVGADLEVDELGGRHAERRRRSPGAEPHADEDVAGIQHLERRPGLRPAHPRRRADAAAQLDAAVGHGAVGVERGIPRHPLDPHARQVGGERRRRPALDVGVPTRRRSHTGIVASA